MGIYIYMRCTNTLTSEKAHHDLLVASGDRGMYFSDSADDDMDDYDDIDLLDDDIPVENDTIDLGTVEESELGASHEEPKVAAVQEEPKAAAVQEKPEADVVQGTLVSEAESDVSLGAPTP